MAVYNHVRLPSAQRTRSWLDGLPCIANTIAVVSDAIRQIVFTIICANR
jgi:hypothetical protein